MTRTLARRLECLEDQITPEEVEPRQWQVMIVHSDGTQELGPLIEWSPTRSSRLASKSV
jgi:hypothetical protein